MVLEAALYTRRPKLVHLPDGRTSTYTSDIAKGLKIAIWAHSYKCTLTFVTDVSKTLFQHYCSIQIHLTF